MMMGYRKGKSIGGLQRKWTEQDGKKDKKERHKGKTRRKDRKERQKGKTERTSGKKMKVTGKH